MVTGCLAQRYEKDLMTEIPEIDLLLGVNQYASLPDQIEKALREYEGFCEGEPVIHHAESMEDAVAQAEKLAKKGDIVALSPASASFDLYPNFEKRGEHFKKVVNQL